MRDKENKSFQNFTDIKGEGIKPGQEWTVGSPDLALRGLTARGASWVPVP